MIPPTSILLALSLGTTGPGTLNAQHAPGLSDPAPTPPPVVDPAPPKPAPKPCPPKHPPGDDCPGCGLG